MLHRSLAALIVAAAALYLHVVRAETRDPARLIADLDTKYQAAVERGDWQAMDRILHADFALVLGDGTVYSRAQLIESARNRNVIFDKQIEVPGSQVVRTYGDHTATVTALLIVKGRRPSNQSEFDYKLWFTDTYVLTTDGWKYAFGQASLALR